MQLAVPIAPLFSLLSFFPKLWNYISRPKLSVQLKSRMFRFKLEDGKEHHYDIPCFIIHNKGKSDIKINANAIWVNNQSYTCFVQTDNLFLTHYHPNALKEVPETNATLVYKFYRDNWLDIAQGCKHLIIPSDTEMLFPFKLIGAGLSHLHYSRKNSKLLFSKKKISFAVGIDDKTYEYGLNRVSCYAAYINYLASHTSRYDSKMCL